MYVPGEIPRAGPSFDGLAALVFEVSGNLRVVFGANSLALVLLLELVPVAVAPAVEKLRALLGGGVVAEPRVVALAGTGHQGQQAGLLAHRGHAHLLASGLVLEIVAVPHSLAAKPKPGGREAKI